MKIIIAGIGKVGAALTKHLAHEGYELTLIDSNIGVLETMEEQYDIMCVQGNCATMNILKQAGVNDADLIITATSSDELNLLCCMTAYSMNQNIHTIARVRNPEYSDQVYQMKSLFTLSYMINPEKLAAIEIERLLKYPGFLKRDVFSKGQMEIVEFKLERYSILNNVKLMDINSVTNSKVLICAVLRDGNVSIPDGNYVLQEDDRIFMTAQTTELTKFLKNTNMLSHKVKKAIICGGSRISYYLATLLEKDGIKVSIIEKNKNRCLELAKNLPSANIICADASNQTVLQKEGIDSTDAVVSLTGVDELNIIISLYAKNCDTPQVITKLGRFDNNNIISGLSIGSIIRPKELCTNRIVTYVRAMKNQSGAAISVHSIADGKAEAFEFLVDSNTLHKGELLKDIALKKNILIAGIITGPTQQIANGMSSFNEGDVVIVIKNGDDVILQLNDIFK